ncbi:unnamed protein product [Closterium sp. NIES-54]
MSDISWAAPGAVAPAAAAPGAAALAAAAPAAAASAGAAPAAAAPGPAALAAAAPAAAATAGAAPAAAAPGAAAPAAAVPRPSSSRSWTLCSRGGVHVGVMVVGVSFVGVVSRGWRVSLLLLPLRLPLLQLSLRGVVVWESGV